MVGITGTDSFVHTRIVPGENTVPARLLFFRVASSGAGDVVFTEANLELVENPGDVSAETVPTVPFFSGSFEIGD